MKHPVAAWLLTLLPALAAPITTTVQILSGTVTVTTSSRGTLASFNLITNTGTLTGSSYAGVTQPVFGSSTSAVVIDPSLYFANTPDATLNILHNGQTYSFQSRLLASTPYYFDPTAFAVSPVSLSPTSQLSFALPFYAFLSLHFDPVFNPPSAYHFQFSGAGTANVEFSRAIETGTNDYRYEFRSAVFTFAAVPEPATAMGAALALAVFAWKVRRQRT